LVQALVGRQRYAVFNPENPSNTDNQATLDSNNDRVILGTSLPKYFGALNFKLRYYNFDVGGTIRFNGGNVIFNSTRRQMLNLNFTNNSTEILGRWQSPENPGDGITPKLIFGDNTYSNQSSYPSTRFIESGDYIKFDILSLGYTLPKAIVESMGLTSLRLFLQAQNAFIFTKYKGLDPEMEITGVDLNANPRQRIIGAGLHVSF